MRAIVVLLFAAVLSAVPVSPLPVALAAAASAENAAPTSATTYARVIKRYGAAIRYAPSSDAGVAWVASCNDTFYVTGQSGGWWQVALNDGSYGWIGGGRVSVGVSPAWGDCYAAVTYQVGSLAYARPTNCLSLRYWPSRDAPYDYCVPWGYEYQVINGPREENGGDWTEVWSAGTGSGWVLMDYLSPW
jgi:hypothetical protein